MELEAVLLTGGASRRMGQDKASLAIDGESLADRMVRILNAANIPVTVLGRRLVDGASFLEDAEDYAGPLSALSRFIPCSHFVLVLSCDMPLFDPSIVSLLRETIGDSDAAVPLTGGYPQPLAALYRASAFTLIGQTIDSGSQSMMAWLRSLRVTEIDETTIRQTHDPRCLIGVNTPEELDALLGVR